MKNIKLIFAFVALIGAMSACEDDSVKAVLKSDVAANELQTPSASSFVLTIENKNDKLATFAWSATDFGFNASVNYSLQIDKSGNNFADAVNIASTNNLSADINVGALNDQLLGLGFTPEEAIAAELRVVSTIGSDVPAIYSNVRAITLSAYATSFPSIYGMGAGLKGWGPWPDNAVEWQSSEFKKYETVAYFKNGETFRWFAQLDWNPTAYNYPFFTSVSSIFVNANDGDLNLKVAGASGWYKVNVDLAAKTVTALAVSEPVLYMTGAGVGGWDQPGTGASVKMNYLKPGVFEGSAPFVSGETFRFFAQADWGPDSYNFPFFTSVDAIFENAADGDSNLRYIGTSGVQKITVDLNAKTVTIGDTPDPVLFITGDDFGWGWGDGQYLQMAYKGNNTFEATANLTANNLFRFFPQKDWSPSYNYSYFTNVDSELENQGAGTDENFKYVGATGSRKITVNLDAKTVVVD